MICIMFSQCSKHNRKVMWNQREKGEINWREEERRFHGSTFCSFLHVSAFHDHALWNALQTWEPWLCVIQFQPGPLPSAHTDKTAWDGKSTWISIYYGRCCFRQVPFSKNLLCIHRCYGNNLLIEVFLQSFSPQCSSKRAYIGFGMKAQVHYGYLSYIEQNLKDLRSNILDMFCQQHIQREDHHQDRPECLEIFVCPVKIESLCTIEPIILQN